MKHDNQIAVRILRHEYADYDYNSYHYDQEYKMLVEAQDQALAIAVVSGSSSDLNNMISKLNKVRADNAFRGVITHGYPSELLEVIEYLETLKENCR